MDTSNQKLKILQEIVNVVGMTIAFVLFFNDQCNLNIHWIVVVLSTSMLFLFLLLMEYNKINVVSNILILFFFLFGLIVLSYLKIVNIFMAITKLVRWFYNYQLTKENYQITNAFAMLFLFAAVVMILCYFINKKLVIKCFAFLGLLVVLVYLSIHQISVNKATIAMILLYMLQVIVQVSNQVYNKKKRLDGQTDSIYMLPLCILIVIIAMSLPSKSQPIQWKIVKNLVSTVADKYDDISFLFSQLSEGSSETFGLSFTGYSDQSGGILGGSVKKSNRVILKVSPNTKENGSTYLIGNVSNEYDLNEWKKTDIDYGYKQEPMVDFYEMLYGLYQQQLIPKENERLLQQRQLNINYHKIETKSLFYPLKTYRLDIPKNNKDKEFLYDSKTPSMYVKKALKRGFSYKVSYYEINYKSETLQNYLRKVSKINDKQNTRSQGSGLAVSAFDNATCIAYLQNTLKLTSFEEEFLNNEFIDYLENRPELIRKYYNQVPKTLPKRVSELAEHITQEYDNNYDKLKAIEEYLATFTYTLSPSKTKEGEDFIDYFLFEEKEGYCTYFATSMAILARCVGIPTRYVEGVLVDYDTKENHKYLVSSNSSHAWVEAYIEGFGWVPFEPTPNMQDDRYTTWRERTTNLQPVQPTQKPEFSEVERTEQIEQKEAMAEVKRLRTKYFVTLCIIIIMVIVILMVVVVILLKHNKVKKYKNAPREEKVKYLLDDIMSYLKSEGEEIALGETLLDYLTRLGQNYDFEEVTLEVVFSIYSRLRYANAKISDSEFELLLIYRKKLKDHMRAKIGWVRFIKYSIIQVS